MATGIMCFSSSSEAFPCISGAGSSYTRIGLPAGVLSSPQGRPSQSPTSTQPLLRCFPYLASTISAKISDPLKISKPEQRCISGALLPATSSPLNSLLAGNLGESELQLSVNDDGIMSQPHRFPALPDQMCMTPVGSDEGSAIDVFQNRSLSEELPTGTEVFGGCGPVRLRTHVSETSIKHEDVFVSEDGALVEGSSTTGTMEEFKENPLDRPHNTRRRRRNIDLVLQGNKKAMQKVFRNRRSAARSNAKRRRVRQQYQLEMEQMIDEKERLEAIKEELIEMNTRLKAQLARVCQEGPSI